MEERRNEIYNSYGQGDGSHFRKAVNAANNWNEEHGPDSGGFWAGVGDFFGNIWNDLTGKNAQGREFAQQEYLQEKQWEHDSPAAQMERMKAAGINPNIAAAGVAGGNVSQSAPQVASPTPLGNPIDTIANIGSSAAGAFKNVADGIAGLTKLPSEVENIQADTGLKGSLTFLNDTEREGLEIDNKYRDKSNVAELNWRNQQIENMKKDWDVIDKQSQYLQKQLDCYDEQIEAELDLTRKRALEAEKHAFELQQRGNLAKQEYDFHEKYAYSRFSNADTVAFNLFKKGFDSGDFSEFEQFNQKYGEWLKKRSYNEEIGRQQAETEFTFEKYQEQYRAEEINKRASNAFELFQRATSSNGGYSWFNRVTGIAFDGSIKEYRAFLDSQIDALADKMESSSTSDRELYLKLYDEMVYARSLPKRALMNYLNDMKKRSNQ